MKTSKSIDELITKRHNCRPINLKNRDHNYKALILSQNLHQVPQSLAYLHDCNVLKTKNSLLKEIEFKNIEGDNKNLTLNWPSNICCCQNNDLILCDTQNHRLVILNKDLIVKSLFGSFGNENGQFNLPIDAECILSDLYVVDCNNLRVQIFNEKYRLKKCKTKFNFLLNTTLGNRVKKIVNENIKYLDYSYRSSISFIEKPIKIVKSVSQSIFAVSTLSGSIFIYSNLNVLISSLKLNDSLDIFDMRNIFFSDKDDELAMLKYSNGNLCLRFYHTSNMTLNRVNELKRDFLPGIFLSRITCMTVSSSHKTLFIFDKKNSCILEYYLSGEFKRIVYRSYDTIANVLAMNITNELHFITCEQQIKFFKKRYMSLNGRPKTSNEYQVNLFYLRLRNLNECLCHKERKVKHDLNKNVHF